MVTLATLFVASVITTQGSTRTSYRLDLAPEPPENLRVEGLLAPTAIISETKPRFSFIHKLSPQQGFGVVQASYRITVRKSGADTLTWDSGDVASPMCSEIEYGGTRLAPFTVYVWTAEWTPSGGAASRSGTANSTFETGPMNPWDWKNAGWLTALGASSENSHDLVGGRPPPSTIPPGQLRQTFNLPAGATVTRARAFIAAPGCHVLQVNGAVPAPDLRGICPWVVNASAGGVQANTRYQTHDIGPLLRPGKNAMGIIVGQVMDTSGTIIVLAMVELSDGSQHFFSSGDDGWMLSTSYVTIGNAWSSTIDWREEELGWSTPDFQPTSKWAPVKASSTLPMPKRALQMPLSTVVGQVKPVMVEALSDGSFLYTFPKNFVGTLQLKPMPNAGPNASVDILAGEWLGNTSTPKPHPSPPTPIPPPGPPALCGKMPEKGRLDLGGCPAGQSIASIEFASYGTPTGTCATGFKLSDCNANTSVAVMTKLCVGKVSCEVNVSNHPFRGDPCWGTHKWLAAQVKCGPALPSPVTTVAVQTRDPLPPLPPRPDNSTVPTISGGNQQYETHHLRPKNTATLETVFCWHGFQYVRVYPTGNTGFSGSLDAIVGLEIYTNMTKVGSLIFGGDGIEGSEQSRAAQVLTGIQSMTLQSQRTNVAAYMMTDCPTREKHGWLGDALDAVEQSLFNFDTLAVHTAFMQTIADNQGSNGDLPTVVPNSISSRPTGCDDIAWTSAYPQIIDFLHQYRGDTRLAVRHYGSLVKYIENLIANAAKSPHGVAVCDTYADWLCGMGSSKQSCCTNLPANSSCPAPSEMAGFNYVLALRAMSRIATVVGDNANATRYAALSETARAGFHALFWNPSLQAYGGDVGATQVLTTPALVIGSPPDGLKPTVIATLERNLAVTTGYRPYVGAVTSKGLLNVLSENGLHSTALQTAASTEQPSWGYWWSQNSTTCWEDWLIHGTRNHIFLCGGVGEWMWKHLIGLTPAAPQFTRVSINPKVHPTLGPASASGTFVSPSGSIAVSWKVSAQGALVVLNVTLPTGVQLATVAVPKPFGKGGGAVSKSSVTLSGDVVWNGSELVGTHPGLINATDSAEAVIFQAKNGVYQFESTPQAL